MAYYQPGINLSTAGALAELGANLVGPVRLFHDLGKDNGDLIRSGNATIVRVAVSPMFLAAQGFPGAGAFPMCKPNFLFAAALAQTMNQVCTQNAAITSDGLLGMVTSGGLATNSYSGTYVLTAARCAASNTIGAPTVSASGPADQFFGMGAAGFNAESNVGYPCWFHLEFRVASEYTIEVRYGFSLEGASAANIKSAMRNTVRTTSNGELLSTVTTTTCTAKEYLAQFPYFLIQWPVASYPMSLMHACSFVA